MIRLTAVCTHCGNEEWIAGKTVTKGLRVALESGWTLIESPDDNNNDEFLCEACGVKFGLWIPCPGEAHQIIKNGGDQDHCMVCAPRWGLVRPVVMPAYPEIMGKILEAERVELEAADNLRKAELETKLLPLGMTGKDPVDTKLYIQQTANGGEWVNVPGYEYEIDSGSYLEEATQAIAQLRMFSKRYNCYYRLMYITTELVNEG